MSETNNRAGNALFNQMDQLQGLGLLIADEGFSLDQNIGELNLRVITNRYDIAKEFDQSDLEVLISDFQFDALEVKAFDYILLRLPKSKVLAEHIYNAISSLLKIGGRLVITGFNQEGVKRVIKNLSDQLGELEESDLLGKGLRYAQIVKRHTAIEQTDATERYQQELSILDEHGNRYFSKPGLYGYEKIDQGSQFLIDYLTEIKKDLTLKALDLGCGFGYLSVRYAQLMGLEGCKIYATDANIAAVEMCLKNIDDYKINGEVTLDDCGEELSERSFKTIICNPPFHQGFATSEALTDKFIRETKRLLASRGSAYFVVNRFIAIENICKSYQLAYEEVAANNQFKILKMKHKLR